MSLRAILHKHYKSDELMQMQIETKFVTDNGIDFPVLYCQNRASRPYQNYTLLSKDDCPLCMLACGGKTNPSIIQGFEWLPATWPIKALHGICYPREHRAGIIVSDLCRLGNFADTANDIVECINMYGSAASIPVHFHAQIHDNSLPLSEKPAFPLLSCKTELIEANNNISLYRVLKYPAYMLLLKGPWEMLGRWMITYFASVNNRPHNFVLAPGGKLYVIPRSREKAPTQENKYGASEMLGLITPITYNAYKAIDNGKIISNALRLCGVENATEIRAIEEHTLWTINQIKDEM